MELAEVGVTPAAILQTVADLWERSIQRHFEKAERALNAAPGSQDIILLMGGVTHGRCLGFDRENAAKR